MVAARQEIRNRRLSEHTEKAYLDWMYRFLTFHHTLLPDELTEKEIGTFLSFQAVSKQAPSSTQNLALHAVLFLYRHVFKRTAKKIRFIRVKRTTGNLTVFSREEIRQLLLQLTGEKKLIISLLYGCGLNLNECLSLRIQDVDFEDNILFIRKTSTEETRTLRIPDKLREEMISRVEALRYRFMHLSIHGYCGVSIPESVKNSQPEAEKSFSWFFLFPTMKPVRLVGKGSERFHHRSETYVQKALRNVLKKAGIKKKASCRSLRHSYAVHLLKEGRDIYDVQKLLGHKNIRNTLVYKQFIKTQSGVPDSPLDNL
ncbi:MAG: integron integrase [Bacteroidales bacterium]|nr:integron integrase [Bacteroidales bacterium]